MGGTRKRGEDWGSTSSIAQVRGGGGLEVAPHALVRHHSGTGGERITYHRAMVHINQLSYHEPLAGASTGHQLPPLPQAPGGLPQTLPSTHPSQVLQLAINSHRYHKHQADYDGGVHRIAWAFLRLAGGGPPGPGGGSGPLLGRLPLQVRGKGGDTSGQPPHPHTPAVI